MRPEAFHFLLTPRGQALLAEAAREPIIPTNHLQRVTALRQLVEPVLAQAIVETALLRQHAAAKFSRASNMYFTRDALEQASAETVAAYRAESFASRGLRLVADLGCGIGGDALALAATAEVVGIDRSQLRLEMARENVAAYGHAGRFHPVEADLRSMPPLQVEAVFFDPARRTERGRRIYSVEEYHPPLSLIDRWRHRVPHAAVKISPGVDYAELPPDAGVEFISLAGEVKEALLWYGDLRDGTQRRATLLPAAHTLSEQDAPGPPVAVTTPQAYLYEPDGAVIRAHLVQPLARLLGAAQIDEEIAYLTSAARVATPFARCFRVEEWFPFQLKQLRHYLRERNVGRATIKKRGSPIDPDVLRRQLRLSGEEHRVVFLTLVQGQPAVVVGEEVD